MNLLESYRMKGRSEMRIIALCGAGNIGKTETLKDLIQTCYRNGATQITSQSNSRSAGDVIEVFSYQGKTICVSTGRDDAQTITDGHQVAVRQSCDVFVTAARGQLNSPTLTCVCALAAPGAYPILLSAYWEDVSIRPLAKAARVDALLRCL